MSKQIETRSAFEQIDWSLINCDPALLSVRELAAQSHINVRGRVDDAAFMQAAENVLGVALPTKANTFVEHGTATIVWLGPDEWLIVDQLQAGAQTTARLRATTQAQFCSVFDISGGNALLEIQGEHAVALLSKGCPLDLHAREFKSGDAAQTLLAKSGITLWKTQDTPTFKVLVRRSFADYVGLWLIDAAREFCQ